MIVYPAIDLAGGKCVRLEKGRFDRQTTYGDDPLAVARAFAAAGATALHVVDLDGARDPGARQVRSITALAGVPALAVQAGGGIRGLDDARRLLDAGAARVVLGSIAVREPATTSAILARLGPARVVLALDVRLDGGGAPRLAVAGWREQTALTLWEALARYATDGLRTVLCTDIERDGVLAGPSLALYGAFLARHPELELLASGGVAALDDLRALARLGTHGAVVGRALYEGRFTLTEALSCSLAA